MKAFLVMSVLLAVQALATPIASAQDGWPGCPWGAAYEELAHGYVAECFTATLANEPAASKAAGRAAPAPP